MIKNLLLLISILLISPILLAANIIEPKDGIKNGIALTIDMCGGKTDTNILELLIKTNTKATIFVTSKWMKKNKETVFLINNHPELFKVENHGLNHVAALIVEKSPYGLKTVKSIDGLKNEVELNNVEIKNNFTNLSEPIYYRTAGAQYDKESINWLNSQNYKIGSYTIAADGGAKLSSKLVLLNLKKAKNGDIVLIHGNHPESGNYNALNEYLQNNNSKFVWLD